MNQDGTRICGSEPHHLCVATNVLTLFCRLGPLSPADKFTFRVEAQLGSVPLLGRSTIIASTVPYTVDSLLAMQGKQTLNGSKFIADPVVKGSFYLILHTFIRCSTAIEITGER
jgi:hypothetical protein